VLPRVAPDPRGHHSIVTARLAVEDDDDDDDLARLARRAAELLKLTVEVRDLVSQLCSCC
jgi:hypothetical protein